MILNRRGTRQPAVCLRYENGSPPIGTPLETDMPDSSKDIGAIDGEVRCKAEKTIPALDSASILAPGAMCPPETGMQRPQQQSASSDDDEIHKPKLPAEDSQGLQRLLARRTA